MLLSTLARLTPPSTSCCCEAKAGAWLCPADAGASPNGVLLTGLRASRCSRGCGVRPAAASVLLAGILLSCSFLDRQGLAVAQHKALSNSGAVPCASALMLLAPFPKPPLCVLLGVWLPNNYPGKDRSSWIFSQPVQHTSCSSGRRCGHLGVSRIVCSLLGGRCGYARAAVSIGRG